MRYKNLFGNLNILMVQNHLFSMVQSNHKPLKNNILQVKKFIQISKNEKG